MAIAAQLDSPVKLANQQINSILIERLNSISGGNASISALNSLSMKLNCYLSLPGEKNVDDIYLFYIAASAEPNEKPFILKTLFATKPTDPEDATLNLKNLQMLPLLLLTRSDVCLKNPQIKEYLDCEISSLPDNHKKRVEEYLSQDIHVSL